MIVFIACLLCKGAVKNWFMWRCFFFAIFLLVEAVGWSARPVLSAIHNSFSVFVYCVHTVSTSVLWTTGSDPLRLVAAPAGVRYPCWCCSAFACLLGGSGRTTGYYMYRLKIPAYYYGFSSPGPSRPSFYILGVHRHDVTPWHGETAVVADATCNRNQLKYV